MKSSIKDKYLEKFSSAPLDALLGRTTAAAAIGHSVTWLKHHMNEGPKFMRDRFYYYYRKSDILRWLEERA